MARLWELREGASSALAVLGNVPYKYDVSLPLPRIYELVEETRARFADREDVSVIGYGHLGDCNLHLNVGAPAEAPSVLETIEPFVYEFVCAFPAEPPFRSRFPPPPTGRCTRRRSQASRQHQCRARHRGGQATVPAPQQARGSHRPHEADQGRV